MTDVTAVAKTIKANLKALGITAKTQSCRGFQTDSIYVRVEDELIKSVYELTREYETDCLVIIVKS